MKTALVAAFSPSATDANNQGVATVAAAFVQDQVRLGRYVEAVAGLRYDRFGVNFLNNRTAARFRSDDNLVSPRVGLVIKPVEPVSVYSSYSLSYQPRAGEQLSSLTLTNQALDPEVFTNYEAGVKWDIRRSLSFSLAAYRVNRGNVAIADPADATATVLVDGQRSSGLEIGIAGQVTSAWSVLGGYAHQDGIITRTQSASVLAGSRLAQLPAHSYSIWNRYQVSPRVGAGVGLIHRGSIFASTDNAVLLPAFTRVDTALFVALAKRLRGQLNLENMLNVAYFSSAHSNNNIMPGSPRAIRVSLTTQF